MKLSSIFPSKYVRAADLEGRTITLTIKAVTIEEMVTHDNKKVDKPVVWFERATKGFVMNLTNALSISKLYGDETDLWVGKRISLYPTTVKAFGQIQDCIRIREEIPAQPVAQTGNNRPDDASGIDDDEDIADVDYDDGPPPPQHPPGGASYAYDNVALRAGDGTSAEDYPPDNPFHDPPATDPATEAKRKELLGRAHKLGERLHGDDWPVIRAEMVYSLTDGQTGSSADLRPEQIEQLIAQLAAGLNERVMHRNGAERVAA